MEPSGDHMEKVKAQVPLSSMYRFPIDLRSMTQGRGVYSMSFSHYEEVPSHLQEKIVAEAQKEREAAEKK
jgi:elongation factor G